MSTDPLGIPSRSGIPIRSRSRARVSALVSAVLVVLAGAVVAG